MRGREEVMWCGGLGGTVGGFGCFADWEVGLEGEMERATRDEACRGGGGGLRGGRLGGLLLASSSCLCTTKGLCAE